LPGHSHVPPLRDVCRCFTIFPLLAHRLFQHLPKKMVCEGSPSLSNIVWW
jgi:hypothetical protein